MVSIYPPFKKFIETVALDHYCANFLPDPNEGYSIFAELPLPIVKQIFAFGASEKELAAVPFERHVEAFCVESSYKLVLKNLDNEKRIPKCSCLDYCKWSRCQEPHYFFGEKSKDCKFCHRPFLKPCPRLKKYKVVPKSAVEAKMKENKTQTFRNFDALSKKIYFCSICETLNRVFTDDEEIESLTTEKCEHCCSLPFSGIDFEQLTEIKHIPFNRYNVLCPKKFYQHINGHINNYQLGTEEINKVACWLNNHYHNSALFVKNLKKQWAQHHEIWCTRNELPRFRTKIRNELMLLGKETLKEDPQALEKIRELNKPTLAPKKAKIENTGAVSPQHGRPLEISDDSSDDESQND